MQARFDQPVGGKMNNFCRRALLALTALTVGVTGCADADPIDRTQPDLINKDDLKGEFYSLSTVVRSPYTSVAAFPGLQGVTDRGVWQIEEKALIFYRTYEFVDGTEEQGVRSDTDTPLLDDDGNPVTYEKTLPDGSVVTATRYVYRSAPLRRYPILGHYDVRKSYNPLTGEEANVTNEDSSEKFWFQRSAMRVDFSTNQAPNNGDMQFGSGVVSIFEGEEAPDDLALRVEDDGDYMDYVVRGYIEAPRTYLRGWGWVPTCLFFPWYTGAYFECEEEEHHIRSAFMRVDPNNTYVPQDFNDNLLNKFGFYRSSRAAHDKEFGRTYSDAIRNIRRFRIWEDYVVGSDGKLDYAQMTPKPIVYYLSEDFPRDLIRGSLDLARQWNKPFKEVVETRLGRAFDGDMYVLCENNTAAVQAVLADNPNAATASTDPRYCKDMDKPKLMGDLRYNMLTSVNDPIQYGLYGYGPMHSDPITGEIIHANAYQYTANMRLGARNAVDMIEYAAGVQSFRDITQARHITTSVKARALGNTEGAPKSLSLEDAQLQAGTVVMPAVQEELQAVGLELTDHDHGRARMNALLGTDEFDHLLLNQDMAALAGLPVDEFGSFDQRDSGFLKDLVHPAHLSTEDSILWKQKKDVALGHAAICMGEHFDDSFRGFALDYKDDYDSAVCTQLKALADDGEDLVFDFEAFAEPGQSCDSGPAACGENQVCQFLNQGDVSGNYCMTPCSAGALLQQLRDELRRVNQISQFVYWDPNALYTDTKDGRVLASQAAARKIIEEVREETFVDVFDRIWSTVAMHEVGHNVGLRHNFESSTDALNYFPGYWDLKGRATNNGWEAYDLWEGETNNQTINRMREFQQTSIMEYTGAFNARFQGLGAYDRGAILYGYGGLVEVFENPPAVSDWEGFLAEPSDSDPDLYGLNGRREQPLAFALRKVHHTNYPDVFGSVDNITARRIVDAEDVADLNKPCTKHDNPYDSSVCGAAGSFCQPFPSGFYCTKPDMVEVPLRFCSDEYNWSSPTCQTHDEGTDSFEIVRNLIEDYEAYWPFRAYQRDNDLFSPSTGYWGRVMYDMQALRKHFEHWANNLARYNHNNWWEEQYGQAWHLDINGGLGDTLAAKALFEHMANIFGRPNDGYYGFNEQRQVYEPYVDNGRNTYVNVFQVREDVGARPMYPAYDFSGYLYTPARAGTFYDRLAALMMMTYPRMIFIRGVDTTYDLRRFRLNFGTVWPQRMHNLLTGLVTSDPNLFGWCIEHDGVSPTNGGNGDPQGVKPRMWFGSKTQLDAHYANCTPLNPEPQYDFPTTQYRIPAVAAIYGMAWMSGTYDRSFIDRSRLWLEGDGSDITVPPGFATIDYTDPYSGKKYIAAYDPNEDDPYADVDPRGMMPSDDLTQAQHVYWAPARLLANLNDELDQYRDPTTGDINYSALGAEYSYSLLQETVGRLEILRGLYRRMDFGF